MFVLIQHENKEPHDAKGKTLGLEKQQAARERERERKKGRERERVFFSVNANQVWIYWAHEKLKHSESSPSIFPSYFPDSDFLSPTWITDYRLYILPLLVPLHPLLTNTFLTLGLMKVTSIYWTLSGCSVFLTGKTC